MIRIFSLSAICLGLTLSCASQQSEKVQEAPKEQITIVPGTYSAVVSQEKIPDDVKAFHVTSRINFGFEADNTFIYRVAAMGREIDDVGRWEIRGDSLFIFGLQKGPNSAFRLVKVSEESYEIHGPNHFILTRQEEVTPIKE
ncbi:MAG: hypothetical protein IPL46_33900 [Saprospiraceae bacterium]|nr:hypothetical protein [Saprospiraceae bacterium]